MAGNEGRGSPTPSEQGDYDNKDSNIEYEEEGVQDNEATPNDQDGEHDPQTNDEEENLNAATNDVVIEPVMGHDSNDLAPHQETNTDVMMEDADGGPDFEEQLGGMIIGEIEYPNGQVDLLVVSIESSLGTPEL